MVKLKGLRIKAVTKEGRHSNGFNLLLSDGSSLHVWPQLLTKPRKPKKVVNGKVVFTLADYLQKEKVSYFADKRKDVTRIKLTTTRVKEMFRKLKKVLAGNDKVVSVTIETVSIGYMSRMDNRTEGVVIRTKHLTPANLIL